MHIWQRSYFSRDPKIYLGNYDHRLEVIIESWESKFSNGVKRHRALIGQEVVEIL